MSGDRQRLEERIQSLVDDRLSHEEREELDRQIADDRGAQELLESLRWLKTLTRDALGDAGSPAGLESAILAGLDRECSTSPQVESSAVTVRPWRRVFLGVAATAAVLALMWLLMPVETGPDPIPPKPPSLVLAAAEHVRQLASGDLALLHTTADVDDMEIWFDRQGIDFETRVFDLAMMDLTLIGGSAHQLAGHRSAAFAYRRGDGLLVLCQMFVAGIDALPEEATIIENDGIRFYSFRKGGVALTFWQEGDVLCVLGSTGDAQQLLQLAFGKAVKV